MLSAIDISNLNEWKVLFRNTPEIPIGKIIYYSTLIIAITFGIVGISNSKNVAILEKANQKISNKIILFEKLLDDTIAKWNNLFNSYLTLLVKNLNFRHTERVSVYKVINNSFRLVGCASENPFLKKNENESYPIDEGFIGKGWAEGEFFIDDLPDPSLKGGDPYFNQLNSLFKIDRETAQNIDMKSRTYFVYRINGYDGQPKAVMVVESLNRNGFNKKEVINKLMNIRQSLVMFVENSIEYISVLLTSNR